MSTNRERIELRTNNHKYGERAFWVKGKEAVMAKDKILTVILRLGDRSDPELAPKQWLPLLQSIPVYCIAVPGDQTKGMPTFEPDQGITVKIVRRTVTRPCDILDEDLFYCYPNKDGTHNVGSAVPEEVYEVFSYLENDFGLKPENIGPDTLVTVYWVEYLENEAPATD